MVISASSSDSEDELCCLYCGRHRNQPIMYCAALVLSLFLDGARNNTVIDHAALILSVFATRPQGEELRLYTLIVTMVPIDSSRQELLSACFCA